MVKEYLINYARTLIYTTSLSYANIISANCSFDILESGRADEVGGIREREPCADPNHSSRAMFWHSADT